MVLCPEFGVLVNCSVRGIIICPSCYCREGHADGSGRDWAGIFGGKKRFQIGKFLIGTVKGDIHDIGKNIVIMMLKANGWR